MASRLWRSMVRPIKYRRCATIKDIQVRRHKAVADSTVSATAIKLLSTHYSLPTKKAFPKGRLSFDFIGLERYARLEDCNLLEACLFVLQLIAINRSDNLLDKAFQNYLRLLVLDH